MIPHATQNQPTDGTQNNSSNQSSSNVTDPLASESTFLTLLVSQLQNQDPLNPMDSTQFVSQLTSYSQLEQLIDINKNTTPATTTNSTTGN
jgi:flagellar basal-body rod modification protein FlgD